MAKKGSLRICPNGHRYYKGSDCPTCPGCESERKAGNGFLALLPAPARRALENKGINTIEELAKYSEKEVLDLHGMGPSSMPKLKAALKEVRLKFRN